MHSKHSNAFDIRKHIRLDVKNSTFTWCTVVIVELLMCNCFEESTIWGRKTCFEVHLDNVFKYWRIIFSRSVLDNLSMSAQCHRYCGFLVCGRGVELCRLARRFHEKVVVTKLAWYLSVWTPVGPSGRVHSIHTWLDYGQ